ncbi:hypothetical protein SERLA73DRAFT_43533, partial [Serpula lacrymans var. lacrymans S7.3]
VFMDDVSGNVSKQWNKHHVVYISNASMPREMLEKEFCVQFVSSSPHAVPMELMKGVKDSITEASSSGVLTWDCKYEQEVMLQPYLLFVAGDNPMHAEECSHSGLQSNFFCRTCKVGGTQAHKKTDEGYQKVFKVSLTCKAIKHQINTSLEPGGTKKVKMATTNSGIRDTANDLIIRHLLELGKQLCKREEGKPALPEAEELETVLQGATLDDHINPLLEMPGVDVHQDTPSKILHTVLLGVVKYFWGQTVWLLDKAHLLTIFQARLESLSKDGLNSPQLGAEYICRYKGGLIGKHFKSLARVMPYLIYDLVPQDVLHAWSVIGDLVVLLWHTGIDNLEEYLVSAESLVFGRT